MKARSWIRLAFYLGIIGVAFLYESWVFAILGVWVYGLQLEITDLEEKIKR